MNTMKIVIPNSTDSPFLKELRDRLANGNTVAMSFTGSSMLPAIDGDKDTIELAPLSSDTEIQVGEVCMFVHRGRYVVHRLVATNDDTLVFRGDNNVAVEHVRRPDVVARLVCIHHCDGSQTDCTTQDWRKRTLNAARRRRLFNMTKSLFRHDCRIQIRPYYFGLVAILMWAPIGGLGAVLDNYILGLRADHLLHAVLFVPCSLFIMDLFRSSTRAVMIICTWLVALAAATFAECVQMVLPYRGFDVNDLAANAIGVTVGWIPVVIHLLETTRADRAAMDDNQCR